MDNSTQENSSYSEGFAINYSGLSSQDRYLMSGNNSAFSTNPSSRNSFEMSSGANQRQTTASQVNSVATRAQISINVSKSLIDMIFRGQIKIGPQVFRDFCETKRNSHTYYCLNSTSHEIHIPNTTLDETIILKGMISQASSRPLSPDDVALQYYGSNSGFQSGTRNTTYCLNSFFMLQTRPLALASSLSVRNCRGA